MVKQTKRRNSSSRSALIRDLLDTRPPHRNQGELRRHEERIQRNDNENDENIANCLAERDRGDRFRGLQQEQETTGRVVHYLSRY